MDDLLLSLPMMARVQPGPGVGDADATVQVVFIDGDNSVLVTLSLPFDAAVLLRRGVLLGDKADGIAAVVSVEGNGVSEGLAVAVEAAVAAVVPAGPAWLRNTCLAVHRAMQQPSTTLTTVGEASAPFTFQAVAPMQQKVLEFSKQAAIFGGEKRTLMRTPVKVNN